MNPKGLQAGDGPRSWPIADARGPPPGAASSGRGRLRRHAGRRQLPLRSPPPENHGTTVQLPGTPVDGEIDQCGTLGVALSIVVSPFLSVTTPATVTVCPAASGGETPALPPTPWCTYTPPPPVAPVSWQKNPCSAAECIFVLSCVKDFKHTFPRQYQRKFGKTKNVFS